jgi:hypothetical protein
MNSIYENNSQMGNRLLGYFQQEIKRTKKKVVEPTSTNLVFSSMYLIYNLSPFRDPSHPNQDHHCFCGLSVMQSTDKCPCSCGPLSISHSHFRLGIQSDTLDPINLNLYSLNLNTFLGVKSENPNLI